MKRRFLIIFLAFIVLGIKGIFLWKIIEKKEKVKVYVLYDPAKDERINWSQFLNLFPADFDHTKTLADIGELLKLDKNQLKIYDSIIVGYYLQRHLVKENNGNNFFLTVDPNTSDLLKKVKKVNQISSDEIVDYPIIPLDSLIKIIPGMEYFQLKTRNKVEFIENLVLHIIVPESNSRTFVIYKVEPIINHYD